MSLQRIWTDAEAEIRFWHLMRRIEEMNSPGRLWWRLTLGPRRARRRSVELRREAEALVERFTLPPSATTASDAPSPTAGQNERLARIHSAIRVAATLANGAPSAASGSVRERGRR